MSEELKESTKILTGSLDIDRFLEGGYEKGIITLFYGPAASGKSNFVTLAACTQAKKGKKVVFIDTEGSLSLDRIKQISKIPEEVLKNIIIYKPTNFYEQKKVFSKLEKECKSKNIGLVIVDSMVMFYRLELAEARKKSQEEARRINSFLANQMKSLYQIAIKLEIPVIITTQVYNDFLSEQDWQNKKEANVNLVGGDILKYWSKCIIELQNKNRKKAILRKHRSLPEKELEFEIYNEGIRKRGWL